ncbi:hypothetical protein HGRIS_013187 [Hohenbuehelia grisea]|uniref:NACHT domain-containing protein n=1 Tax=Hohenbuehelia grisea TaxID=104357 RepID=A0ABR3IUS9_9AGAR
MSVHIGGEGSFSQYYNPQFNDVGRDQVINNYYGDSGASTFLKSLQHATNAGPDPLKLCLPGTRISIRGRIRDWAILPNTDRVLLLSGAAGKGKSAIVHQIARELEDGGLANAPFFAFNRSSRDRHFSQLFFTWARSLAPRCPQYLSYLRHLDILSLERAPLLEQQQILLFREQAQVQMDKPVVFIIDALDECPENEFNHLYHFLTQLLSSPALPTSYLFLLTCRPNQDIDEIFDQPSAAWKISLDGEEQTVEDIRAFVRHELEGHLRVRELIDDVVSAAQEVFECAAVLCRELTLSRPRSTWAHQTLVSAIRTQKITSLYGTYRQVLDISVKHDEKLLKAFRQLMCWIFLVRSPQRRQVFREFAAASLPDDEQSDVDVILSWLGSLLSGATSDGTPVMPLHTSLRDFLVNRSESDIYCVDLGPRAQQELALSCIKLMNAKLKFNICRLSTSCTLNAEILDLAERVGQYISPGLQYASLSAASHLRSTSELPPHESNGQSLLGAQERDPQSLAMDIALATELEYFLAKKFLFWLEAHSCMRTSTGGPAAMLQQFLAWSKSIRNRDSESVLIDCIRFEKRFREGYMLSAPQVYYSGLVFAPKASKLTTLCETFVDVPFRAVGSVEESWPPTETLVIRTSSSIRSVGISRDSTKIVSGSEDTMICVWDVETGEQVGAALKGHTRRINSVAFSPDGTKIASGSDDGTVRLWDVATGKQVGDPMEGDGYGVNSVAFSPDSTRIVSASSMTIHFWDVETGEQIGTPLGRHDSGITSVAFSPDNTVIASGSSKTIRVWDVETGEELGVPLEMLEEWVESLEHRIMSVAFSPDSPKIVSGSYDGTISVWGEQVDSDSEQAGAPFKGHEHAVISVAFSPDGTKILSGSYDMTIRVWDAETGRQIGRTLEGHELPLNSVAFTPDGSKIVSGSDDKTIRVWDVEMAPGQHASAPLKGRTKIVDSVAFSPDGTKIVSGSYDGSVRVWDVKTGKQVGVPLIGHEPWVRYVAYSLDGTNIVSWSFPQSTVRVWNAETRKQVGAAQVEHTKSVAFSPDGTKIVSGSYDGAVRVWDVERGEQVCTLLEDHEHGGVMSVAFSLDGTKLMSGFENDTIRVWDVETGEQVGVTLEGHGRWVDSPAVAFSPDGTKIAHASGPDNAKRVRVWGVETGEELGVAPEVHKQLVSSVAFSPDGTKIVSMSSDEAIIWDVETMEQVSSPLRGQDFGTMSVVFSPDSTKIVTLSYDRTIRVWTVETGQQVGVTLEAYGLMDSVDSITFSPDSTKIVSACNDRTIRVWDVGTGKQTTGSAPLEVHEHLAKSLVLSPEGTKIVSRAVRAYDTMKVDVKQVGRAMDGPGDPEISFAKPFLVRRDDWIFFAESKEEYHRVLWIPHIFQGLHFELYPCVMVLSALPKLRIDMLGDAWGTRWMDIIREAETSESQTF